jgi:sRNA-binding carbon storage regulator CsrA
MLVITCALGESFYIRHGDEIAEITIQRNKGRHYVSIAIDAPLSFEVARGDIEEWMQDSHSPIQKSSSE